MNWLSTCDMFSVRGVIIFAFLWLACGCEGRKLYEDNQNDEDDSMDCNDGRKIDDPILLPFLLKLRGQEMLPARMKDWVIYFDEKDANDLFEGWTKSYLTELGLSKEDQDIPYGSVFVNNGTNVYVPRMTPIRDDWTEFRVMYAEQLLLDSIDNVKIYIKYDSKMGEMSKSSKRLFQVLLKRARPQTIIVLSSSCNDSCRPDAANPLLALSTCGYIYDKKYEIQCESPAELFTQDFFTKTEASHFERSITPEYQTELPVQLKQELHNILDWLLKRIGQRMRNYMEMAFRKNRFRKTNMDLYNKVNLQISKIKGGKTFEAAKSADLIYNSLFDLNVYLNVTNTPYTFDKFHTFNLYLNYIGQFSKWQLDTTKYANFFEPLKELCLSQISVGNNLMKPAKEIFELEEGVYDLTGVICHENVLYVINGMTTINTIKSGLFDNENCDFDTVFVLAKKNLTINEDLKVPGKNLIIFAPTWIIFKEHVIDLSGKSGGSNGEVESGQSGGDFFGFGLRFDRPDFLKFVTNGGDGSKGRDASEVVSDYRFTDESGGKCAVKKGVEKELFSEHGATHGGPGGSAGAVTLKILRNPAQNYTVVRMDGKDGRDGKIHDIKLRCKNKKEATIPVHDLTEINIPANDIQKMNESSILELFRKIIRNNSKRLSYDVLSFYKDIWTSPIIGETLDSTLNDFLNSTDYSESSREFYEVTSQILHTQIKQTCNMTETQKTLLDFALATIRMTAPAESALPSVIDITSYLKEVSNSVGKKDIDDEYFEMKDKKFRKIIEEANYYLKASLLPSLNRTIAETHKYLKDNADGYLVQGNLSEGRKFQENLVSNSLLRYLTEILQHVQQSLEDFVGKKEPGSSVGTTVEESDEEKLEKKLYFFRYLRNNVTVNEMNAMAEFIKLLKRVVDEDAATNQNTCTRCKRELSYLVSELRNVMKKSPGTCDKCIDLTSHNQKHHKKRSVKDYDNCAECNGDCRLCGWCPFCQDQCDSCVICKQCPWCPRCYELPIIPCTDCNDCNMCPDCPQCRPDLDPNCEGDADCSKYPHCPQCCDACNNCFRCPMCKACHFMSSATPCAICDDCSLCPQCEKCKTDICDTCFDCRECKECPHCQIRNADGPDEDMLDDCDSCPCQECPSCPRCAGLRNFDEIDPPLFWHRNNLDKASNFVRNLQQSRKERLSIEDLDFCDSCPCQECPFCPRCEGLRNFDEIDPPLFWRHRTTNSPELVQCLKVLQSYKLGEKFLEKCSKCSCYECPFCPRCEGRGDFDEIDPPLFWNRNNLDKASNFARNLQKSKKELSSIEDLDFCDSCPCQECPFCPRCEGLRNFDEIDPPLFWHRNNLDKASNFVRNLQTSRKERLSIEDLDFCDSCPCQECPFCPRCEGLRNFDEIDPPLFWRHRPRSSPELVQCLKVLQSYKLGEKFLENCSKCSCYECPFCPRCEGRGDFDEIDPPLFWNRNNLDKASNFVRNLQKIRKKLSSIEDLDFCDSCPCQECPFCPRCEGRGNFDEIDPPLFWRHRPRSSPELLQCLRVLQSYKLGEKFLENCSKCSCYECPFCPRCEGRGNFDEIDPPLFWKRNNLDKASNFAQNLQKSRKERSSIEDYYFCNSCPCQECPFCPRCKEQQNFDDINPPSVWTHRPKSSPDLLECLKVLQSYKLDENVVENCFNCSCDECPFCPSCDGLGEFDEIDPPLFWDIINLGIASDLARNGKEGLSKRTFDACDTCSCDECPFCPRCEGLRNFDEIDRDEFWERKNVDVIKDGSFQNKEDIGTVGETSWISRNSDSGISNRNLSKLSPSYEEDKIRRKDELMEGCAFSPNNQEECLKLADSFSENCVDCIRNIENLYQEVDTLVNKEQCKSEVEELCKDTANLIRRILPEIGNKSENHKDTNYGSLLLLKCSDCNDTLDFFTNKLTAEISRCAQESNYNYREVESKCATNEGIIFHMKGCDPETFSRTFDEIRENFLKEFSQFVTADQDHSHELNHIQSNFGYLLTNIDMLLQEGITLSGVTLNNVLYVTDALIKFKDLKMEYQKRMTELHDFSETDMYDLFTSELSMQNERLGMTSKWLNQLKKLLPWMKKVMQYLGANPKFQEVNERIVEAIRLVSEIGHNVKLVERHRELRNYIKGVRVIEKKEKTTGIEQGILDLKTSFKNTFIKDVFHKAIIMAQNWVFPLTKFYQSIQKIQNKTYDTHLAAVSDVVQEYKKSIMLYTTVHAFDSAKNEVPFYEWNVRTRPTLLHDLFSGKPVILVSEILDGGKKNSLMAKDFEVKFVAGQRQVPGTQEVIDDALKEFWLNLTHSGISYFKFGSRIYRRLTETFTFRHKASTVEREKTKSGMDYVLSPYTTWVLRLEPNSKGEYPNQIQDKIGSIQLVGTGRYVINCADIPDVNQYFIPLNDYSRRNEK